MKRKRPTKRVRLAAALRKEMEPVMRAHGFDHPPKSLNRWSSMNPRADHWERYVGDDRQEIWLDWARWSAPRFRMYWLDQAINRERGHDLGFMLEPWRLGPLTHLLPGGWFGGLCPINSAIRLAMRRVDQLLHYWDTGESSSRLGLEDPAWRFTLSEEYDRETGGMKAFEPES